MSRARFRIFCPNCIRTWVSLTLPHAKIICVFCGDITHEKEVFLVKTEKEIHYFDVPEKEK